MKKNIILASIFLFLVLYLYIFEVKLKEKKTQEKLAKTKIIQTPITEIKDLTIYNSYGKVLLKKDKNTWLVGDKKAEKLQINNILDELKKPYKTLLSTNGEGKLKTYGIDKENAIIKVNNKETLYFGIKTPVGEDRYVYNKQQNKIFTVNNTLFIYIDKEAKEFRDKTISACSTADIKQIVYKNKGKVLNFIKDKEHNKWIELTSKKETNDKFSTFKNLLCSLFASDFTSIKNIKRPDTTIEVVFYDGTKRTFKLQKRKDKALIQFNKEVFELSDYDYSTLTSLLKKEEKKKEKTN